MKYILRIILIIILMIGIYTYAHVNRYRISMGNKVTLKHDSWTGKTLRFHYTRNVWIELSKEEITMERWEEVINGKR